MNAKTKVRKIGNSYGILLPKEALDALCVREGDTLYLTETPGKTMQLSTASPDFDEKMRILEEGIRRYSNALRELAK